MLPVGRQYRVNASSWRAAQLCQRCPFPVITQA